jgi:hypothetical protein
MSKKWLHIFCWTWYSTPVLYIHWSVQNSSPILYCVFLLGATRLSRRGTHDSPCLLCLWVFYFGCSAWVWMNFGRLWERWPDHWRFSRYLTLVQKNLRTGVWCITIVVGSQKDLRSDSDVLLTMVRLVK